jgi:hypothetical protein
MEQAKLKTSLPRTGARSHQALQEAIVQVQKGLLGPPKKSTTLSIQSAS